MEADSARLCSATKTPTEDVMPKFFGFVILIFLSTACTDDIPNCTSGERNVCVCGTGGLGVQVCSGNAWGSCTECQDPEPTLGPSDEASGPGSIQGIAILPGRIDHTGINVQINGLPDFTTLTATTGLYSFEDVPEGIYTVTASHSGYIEVVSEVFAVQPDTQTDVPAIVLGDFTGSFSGVVLLEDSEDHSGTVVLVRGTGHAALTDEAGFWSVEGVSPGGYSVVASHEGFFPTGIADQLARGAQVTQVPTLTLSTEPGRVAGEVLFSASDRSGVAVVATAQWDERITCNGISNASGFFETDDCTPGNYIVLATHPDYLTARLSDIPVIAGGVAEVSIPLVAEGQRPTAITPHSGDLQEIEAGSESDDFEVLITDASGAPVQDVLVFFETSARGSQALVAPNTAATDENGIASTQVLFGFEVGDYTIVATAPDLRRRSAVFSFSVVPGPPRSVADFDAPSEGEAGEVVTISFGAVDEQRNSISDFIGCLHNGREFVTTTAVDGIASFTVELSETTGTVGHAIAAVPWSAADQDGVVDCTLTNVVSINIDVVAGPVDELSELVASTVIPEGDGPVEVSVQLKDRFDNLATAVPVTATWEGTDGTVEVVETTDEGGIASFELPIERPEEVVLTLSAASGVELQITVPGVEPPVPVGLTIGAPDCLTPPSLPDFEIGGYYQIPIAVCDSVGRLVPDAQISVATYADGPGSGIVDVEDLKADGTGQVFVWLTVGTFAGHHWLEAETNDGSASDRIDFQVSAGEAAYLDIISGNDQIGAVGQSLLIPFMVRLTDAYDNPIAGAPLQWGATNGTVRTGRDSTFAVTVDTTTTRYGRSRAWGLASSDEPGTTFTASVADLEATFEVDARSIGLSADGPVHSLPAVWGALTVRADYNGDSSPVALINGEVDPALSVTEAVTGSTWTVCFAGDTVVRNLGQYELALQFGDEVSSPLTIGFGQIGAECSQPRGFCENWQDKNCVDGHCQSDDLVITATGGETFTMGSDDPRSADPLGATHSPPNPVSFTSDLIVQTREVTRSEWTTFMGGNVGGCADCPIDTASWVAAALYLDRLSEASGLQACYFVDCTDFDDPSTCWEVRLRPDCTGYRLPTEAEWEFLARAGNSVDPWPCGPDSSCLSTFANCDSSSPVETGDFQSDGFGLYDMIGNAPEWVWDRYEPYLESDDPRVDPLGAQSDSVIQPARSLDQRLVRGFGCGRVYWRYRRQPLNPTEDQAGFRGVREFDSEPSVWSDSCPAE